MLVPAILSKATRRHYASVSHERTGTIWRTREAFLAYERSLHIEADVDWLLNPGFSVASGRYTNVLEHSPSHQRFDTPISTKDGRSGTVESEPGLEAKSKQVARQIKEILGFIYVQWAALVANDDGEPRPHGLDRFDQRMSETSSQFFSYIHYRTYTHPYCAQRR
jgi:hypothetical protein